MTVLHMWHNYRDVSAAEAYQMAALQTTSQILNNPQAQYAKAQQAHQARLTMNMAMSAPDIGYDSPEPKRKGPGII